MRSHTCLSLDTPCAAGEQEIYLTTSPCLLLPVMILVHGQDDACTALRFLAVNGVLFMVQSTRQASLKTTALNRSLEGEALAVSTPLPPS